VGTKKRTAAASVAALGRPVRQLRNPARPDAGEVQGQGEEVMRPDGNFRRYLERRWPKDISETRAGQLIQSSKLMRQFESCNLLQDFPGRELHVRQLVRAMEFHEAANLFS
jgi:hypothetical protein